MAYEKKYKEALERAKKYYSNTDSETDIELIELIFPELATSRDKKIRKEIITYFQCQSEEEPTRKNIHNKWIDWLKRQAEHANFRNNIQVGDKVTRNEDGVLVNLSQLERVAKPSDKVEPKFKVGDWIVDKSGFVQQVLNFIGGVYTCTYNSFTTDCESNYHLWTIQDAKDGDVLWHSDTASHGTFIFKQIRYDGKVLCYCDYDSEDHFCTGEHHTCCWSSDKCIKPATKEQRDFLFEKMKEDGYEWDAENKALTKIEQK